MSFVDDMGNAIPLNEPKEEPPIDTLASKQAESEPPKVEEKTATPAEDIPEAKAEESEESAVSTVADSDWIAEKGGREYVDFGMKFFDALMDPNYSDAELAETFRTEIPARYNGLAAQIFTNHEDWVNRTVAQRQFGMEFDELKALVEAGGKTQTDRTIEELEQSDDEDDREKAKLLKENSALREARKREQSLLQRELDAAEARRVDSAKQKVTQPIFDTIGSALTAAGFKPLNTKPGVPLTPDQLDRLMVESAVVNLFDNDRAGGAHLTTAYKHIEEKREQAAYSLSPTMLDAAKRITAQVVNRLNDLKIKAQKYEESLAKPALIRKEIPAAAAIGATSAGAGLTANTAIGSNGKRPKPGTREDDKAIVDEVAALRQRGLIS